MCSDDYCTWYVCVSVSQSLSMSVCLFVHLSRTISRQTRYTSDFSMPWAKNLKCTKELERYLLTMDRSAILSHVYSPYTHSLHGAQLYTALFSSNFCLSGLSGCCRLGGGGGGDVHHR